MDIMAHYAFMDNENNVVVQVITGVDENETQTDENGNTVGGSTEAWEQFYQDQIWNSGRYCKRTSYNAATTGYRGKYAALGDIWNGTEFVSPPTIEPIDEP